MPESLPPPRRSSRGTLFLVATPIGNLEDITLRALRVLREVSLIAAEDTRRTARLLHHYAITTPATSLHDHNEQKKTPALLQRLLAGHDIALVSDAGTPAVSDPGFRLVRAAIDAGIRVEPVPGPSALLAALVASGLPTDAFVFVGFPPPKAAARRAWFHALCAETRTIVFFEAPHRIKATLETALDQLGDRPAASARELTKLHEEWLRGRLSTLIERLGQPVGEFTIVIGGAETESIRAPEATDSELLAEFSGLTHAGLDRRQAISTLAKRYNLKSRDVYAAVERGRRP
jgi:16S rRNA (cytidine1402-2'-O)-methyltransferase